MTDSPFKNITDPRIRKIAERFQKTGIHLCDMVHSRERRHPDIQKAINRYQAAHKKLHQAIDNPSVGGADKTALRFLQNQLTSAIRATMGKGFDA